MKFKYTGEAAGFYRGKTYAPGEKFDSEDERFLDHPQFAEVKKAAKKKADD